MPPALSQIPASMAEDPRLAGGYPRIYFDRALKCGLPSSRWASDSPRRVTRPASKEGGAFLLANKCRGSAPCDRRGAKERGAFFIASEVPLKRGKGERSRKSVAVTPSLVSCSGAPYPSKLMHDDERADQAGIRPFPVGGALETALGAGP